MKIRKIYLSTIISALIMCSCDRSKSENEQNSVKNSGQISKNGGGNDSIDETLDEDKSNTGNNGQKKHSGSDNTSNDGNNGSNNGPDEKNKQKPEVDTNAENIEGRYYKGIINVGNTCYMNSILQQIWAMPELVEVINKIDIDKTKFSSGELKNDIIGLKDFFKLMGNDKKISKEEMEKVATNLGWNKSQKDASELMGYLLNASNTDLVKIHVKQISCCVDCKNEYDLVSSENILNCDINGKKLKSCLKKDFFKEIIVDSVFCKDCNNKKNKKKYKKIIKNPEILLIRLNRLITLGYDSNNKLLYNKNDKKVEFPEVLDLKKDWFDENHKPASNESYDLSGIVMHDGGTGGGHYFSYCKLADDKWYQFNDTSFMEVNDTRAMLNEAYGDGKSHLSAYLLVYKKKK